MSTKTAALQKKAGALALHETFYTFTDIQLSEASSLAIKAFPVS
jgi:hypothetical protein